MHHATKNNIELNFHFISVNILSVFYLETKKNAAGFVNRLTALRRSDSDIINVVQPFAVYVMLLLVQYLTHILNERAMQ